MKFDKVMHFLEHFLDAVTICILFFELQTPLILILRLKQLSIEDPPRDVTLQQCAN